MGEMRDMAEPLTVDNVLAVASKLAKKYRKSLK